MFALLVWFKIEQVGSGNPTILHFRKYWTEIIRKQYCSIHTFCLFPRQILKKHYFSQDQSALITNEHQPLPPSPVKVTLQRSGATSLARSSVATIQQKADPFPEENTWKLLWKGDPFWKGEFWYLFKITSIQHHLISQRVGKGQVTLGLH